jgi:L-iditol 2-dehydrogenase
VRAVEYHANDDVRIVELPRPRPGPGEIVVALRACGICGSDVLEWYMRPRAPLYPGHEVVGVVAEVGSGVTGLAHGDRVFVHHHVPCMVCRACRRGATTSCRRFRETRLHPGGLAEYVLVPAENVALDVLRLPDGLDDAAATLVEPLACCVRSVRRAGVGPGDTVAVVGAGLTGLLHVQLALVWGATRIVAIDPIPERRALAREVGASEAPHPDSPELADLGADVVIVTPASAAAAAASLELAGPGGTVVLFGPTGPGESFPFEPHRLFFREITVTSTYSADPTDTRLALDLLASGRVRSGRLITRILPLGQAGEAFRATATHREALKIVLTADAPIG